MQHFSKFIKEIEEHTGEKFDFSNKRHRFHLQENVNRAIDEKEAVIDRIQSVINGAHTFDPNKQKAIYSSK